MHFNFRHKLLAITVFALVVRMTLPVFAQNPTGSIHGIVRDQQGAIIQNATITVSNKATGATRKVNGGDDGIYSVDGLLPGEYEVKVEAQGFSTQLQKMTVQVGNTTSGDVSLRAGAADQVVDIVAEGAPIIDKSNYKIDGVITRQKIDALPLNGRNFLQLALLEPGVGVSVSTPGNANNLFNVSIGGADPALTRITVDGGSVLDYVTGGAAQNFSTETIQEFQISTFNFDLSTGVTSVGAVNIVSRGGTNQFHGNSFVFYRDHSLSALPTLNRSKQDSDPFFRRKQYGGSFGGPIKKDKAFFFGNVEWLNQDSVFSTNNTGFGGVVIPGLPGLNSVTQFDAVTASPYDGLVYNIRGDVKVTNKHNLLLRFSHDDNSTFGPVDANTLPSNWRVNANDDQNLQVGFTSILKQNLVNDFRFNFQSIRNNSLIPTAADCPASNPGCIGLGGAQVRVNGSSLRLGNNINAPQDRNLHRYQFNDNVDWQKGSHRVRFGGELEHDYGKGGWAFLDPALVVTHDPRTVLAVNAQIQSNPALPAAVKAALLLPLPADFTTPGATITLQDLLGLPIAVAFAGIGDPSQPPPFNVEQARQSNRYRFFAQDQWQIKPGFTFTFGASYLYETNLFNHDLAKPALIQPLVGDIAPSQKDKNNIAPSVGFAWDVGNKGKTVIRGGAGIYYDTALFVTRLRERAAIGPLGNGRSQLTGDFFRNTIAFPQIPGLPAPLNLINPAIGASINFTTIPTKFTARNFLDLLNTQVPLLLSQFGALGAKGVTSLDFFKTGTDILDSGNQTPYSEQFSIGVQRQLPHNMALTADFVLRNRLHSLFQNDFNLSNRVAALGGPIIPKCSAANAVNPAIQCSNGPISIITSSGRSSYKALLVKLDKRFSNRFQFTASYALSSLTSFFTGADLTCWFCNHGADGADARHRFTFSGVVDLPLGIQASLISVFASKSPFNATVPSNIDINGDGTFGDTLPGLAINSLNRGTSKKDLFLLVNQFNSTFAGKADAHGAIIAPLVLPSQFQFGDRFQSHDVRFSKTFKFKERYSIQGIVEVFNIFNNANLTGFSTALDQGTLVNGNIVAPTVFNFGQPTDRAGQSFGTGGARAFQLAARFTF
ncbi:MAG: hypothetical protein DMF61_25400 [Blastocatellia bacterium AA13]|nr:MAG: hypothetical protein DMF61_25400 [Blastocatellia bacterium AA13]